MQLNKFISRTELSKLVNKSEVTIKRDIDKLRELKKIKRVGPDKGGYWEILKD